MYEVRLQIGWERLHHWRTEGQKSVQKKVLFCPGEVAGMRDHHQDDTQFQCLTICLLCSFISDSTSSISVNDIILFIDPLGQQNFEFYDASIKTTMNNSEII